MRALRRIALAVALLALLLVAAGQMGLFAGSRPGGLGLRDGHLAPPPATPNAVSSQASGGYHAIAPLAVHGDPPAAFARLKEIVRTYPRTRIIADEPRYLYAEFATRWLGFVDDVEFLLDEERRIIHVRSASRLGRSDLGVNRARIEDIRARFEKGHSR